MLALSNRVKGKVFLEENEIKLANISLKKKSVKPMRFKVISMSVWLISTRDFQTVYICKV